MDTTVIDYCERHQVRSAEELGLNLVFEERKTRGTDTVRCVVFATEEGTGGADVSDTIEAASWEEMKMSYPQTTDLLDEFSRAEHWINGDGDKLRILYVQEVSGNTGLYDDALHASVCYESYDVL